MALPDLRVRIGADTSQLDRAIGASQTQLRNFARNVAVTVGGALTIGLVRDTLRATAQIDNLSKVAGVSVERFQELAIGVRQFGVEQDKLADILKDVNDKFGDFAQTGAGPLADFFENIAPKVGLTAAKFADLSSEQKLGAYIQALRDANVSQADMTFYMEALASDATLLAGAFSDNGAAMQEMIDKARSLGIILDEQTIKKAREAQTSLDLMSEVITMKLAQALVNIAPLLTATASGVEAIARGANTIFNLTPEAQFEDLRAYQLDLENQLKAAQDAADRARSLSAAGVPGQEQALARALADVTALGAAYEEVTNQMRLLGGVAGGESVDLGTINIPLKEITETAKGAAAAVETIDLSFDKVERTLNGVGQAAKSAFVNFVTGAQSARQAVSQLVASLAAMAAERAFMSLFGNFGPFLNPAAPGPNSVLIPPPRPNFFGGGYTGSGPRSGGIDGRGGFPAILHPNETVIDHTRGGAAGMVRVIVEEAPGFATRVRTEAQGVAVQVVQAGIQQYDRLVAPATQRRVAADPRRVG
jgi:hypothetical protein